MEANRFSTMIKEELCQKTSRAFGLKGGKDLASDCCKLSFFASALLFSGTEREDGSILLKSRNQKFLDLCSGIATTFFSLPPLLLRHGILFRKSAELSRVLLAAGISDSFPALPVLLCGECFGYFLRGVFLSCGSLLDPELGYHMELQTGSQTDALLLLSQDAEIPFHKTKRRGKELLYLKGSNNIEDFLTRIGAQTHAMELMDAQMEKSMRALVNRQNNFDAANLSRTLEFNRRLVSAIESLKLENRYDSLPLPLKEVARVRTRYPNDTLARLRDRLSPTLSKSGLYHRAKKLIDIAEQKGESK